MSPEPTDGSSGQDHEDPAAQPGEGEGEEHRADGLELARRIARATAGAGGSPARRAAIRNSASIETRSSAKGNQAGSRWSSGTLLGSMPRSSKSPRGLVCVKLIGAPG